MQFRLVPFCLLLSAFLGTRADPLPDTDPIMAYMARPRYYVIIGVDKIKIASSNADLAYAIVDVKKVQDALTSAGFKPLSNAAPLIGENATRPNVESLLEDIRQLPSKATVLVYYSGHAWSDDASKDLWLQLYDNHKLGDDGLSFSQLLYRARGGRWRGKLEVIIDSCYSGKATSAGNVVFSDLLGPTAVLTSSDRLEPSRSIEIAHGSKVSAFTYALLQATDESFDQANVSHDGILTLDEAKNFAQSQLIEWFNQQKIDGKMTPRLLENENILILKYDPHKKTVLSSPIITIIAEELLQETMVQPPGPISVSFSLSTTNLRRARKLSAELAPQMPQGPEKTAFLKIAGGQFHEGLKDLDAIADSPEIQADPSRQLRYQLFLARLYTATGADTVAAAKYKTALAQNRQEIPNPIKIEAATVYTRARHFDEAESLLTSVTKDKTGFDRANTQALAQSGLGLIYAQRGQYKKAEQTLKTALSLSADEPHSPVAATINSNLGSVYLSDKKLSDAEKQFAKAVELNPTAGIDLSQQASDLEKYSSVLAATKQTEKATDAKKKAETIRTDLLKTEVQTETPDSTPQ